MEAQKVTKPKHKFSEEELNQMLYLWDQEAYNSVHEYLYMKKEWQEIPAGSMHADSVVKENSLREGAVDSEGRTHVDLSSSSENGEDLVFLDLDTSKTVHVIEFYAPWCPHCVAFKSEYIELAASVTRRSLNIPVEFHAVSCELFRVICRAYGIRSFPVIVGYPLGADIREKGIELNPQDGPEITEETIAEDLDLVLAFEENPDKARGASTKEIRDTPANNKELAQKAAARKTSWNSFPSTIEERYHNAAVSFVFLLKDGVFVRGGKLEEPRASALREFLELLDWSTPQGWHVRHMVRDLIENFAVATSSSKNLITIVDQHLSKVVSSGLWGGLHPQFLVDYNLGTVRTSEKAGQENMRWTEACTHLERGLGFSCGLWNLFHIVSLGTSHMDHQLYGFHSGYLTAPADSAEILKRFIEHFFGCEVCRANFIANYDNCGQNHCERLPVIMAGLLSNSDLQWHANYEFARWLLEMHNSVNVRLMREAAQQENRVVTQNEENAAKFPPPKLCPKCWLDDDLEHYDTRHTVQFLQEWYWPHAESRTIQFQSRLKKHTKERIQPLPSNHNTLFTLSSLVMVTGILTVCYHILRRRRRRYYIPKYQ